MLWQDFVFFAMIVRVIGFDAAQPAGHDIVTFTPKKKAILVTHSTSATTWVSRDRH